MSDLKITQLTADASPTSDDIIVTVNNPAGTPGNKKVTLADLLTFIKANLGQASVATGTTDITTASSTYVDMTDMSVTITTTGGKCFVAFTGSIDCDAAILIKLKIIIDSTDLQFQEVYIPSANKDYPVTITVLTAPVAGSHTFKVQWLATAAGGTAKQYGSSFKRNLTVIELPF